MKDYYEILGLKRGASSAEIKAAYRRLAQKYHPDKGGDQERFKEINEAYQVLSNPQKKAAYDQFGSATFNGEQAGDGFGGFRGFGGFGEGFSGFGFQGDLGDIFESFFGQAFSQVQVEVPVKLTQALLGGTIKFKAHGNEEIELKLPPATQNGQAFRFKGKGLPYKGGRGDLIAVVNIEYPRRLTHEQRELIEKLQEKGL